MDGRTDGRPELNCGVYSIVTRTSSSSDRGRCSVWTGHGRYRDDASMICLELQCNWGAFGLNPVHYYTRVVYTYCTLLDTCTVRTCMYIAGKYSARITVPGSSTPYVIYLLGLSRIGLFIICRQRQREKERARRREQM